MFFLILMRAVWRARAFQIHASLGSTRIKLAPGAASSGTCTSRKVGVALTSLTEGSLRRASRRPACSCSCLHQPCWEVRAGLYQCGVQALQGWQVHGQGGGDFSRWAERCRQAPLGVWVLLLPRWVGNAARPSPPPPHPRPTPSPPVSATPHGPLWCCSPSPVAAFKLSAPPLLPVLRPHPVPSLVAPTSLIQSSGQVR
jgi:hypothetical protein